MQPHLQGVEIEAVRRGDDDLAVEHTLRQRRHQDVMQIWKVAIERPEVATLDEEVRRPAKHDRPEAVPLGLVQEAIAGGQLLGELCQHRLDRRLNWKCGHKRSYPAVFSGTSRPEMRVQGFIRPMLPSTFSDLDLQGVPSHDRKRLALLAEVSESIASHRDLNALFRDLAQRLPRVVPFDYINLVLHDSSRNTMRLRLLVAPAKRLSRPGRSSRSTTPPVGSCGRRRNHLIVNDIALEHRFSGAHPPPARERRAVVLRRPFDDSARPAWGHGIRQPAAACIP